MDVIIFKPLPLYPQRKNPCYPLDRMDWHQSHSEHGGEEKNSQPQLGLEIPIVQPVAQRYTTELSRFLHHMQLSKITIRKA